MILAVHEALAADEVGGECRNAVDLVVGVVVLFCFQRAQVSHVGIDTEGGNTETQFGLRTSHFQTTRVDIFRRRGVCTRVVDNDVCQMVVEEVNVVVEMPAVYPSHEVELDSIHKFGHQILTTACTVSRVMTIEIGRIHKGSRERQFRTEFLIGEVDQSHTGRKSSDIFSIGTILVVKSQTGIKNKLRRKIVLTLNKD